MVESGITPAEEHAPISEMIGNSAPMNNATIRPYSSPYGISPYWPAPVYYQTVDATRPDYGWYDKLRRGKAKGFELVPFPKAATQILSSYEVGDEIGAVLVESGNPNDNNDNRTHTNDLLRRFMRRERPTFVKLEEDKFALGDQYVIVNPDGTLTVPSPDTVTPEYDPMDYRHIIAYKVTTIFDKYEVTEVYTATVRERRIMVGGQIIRTETFPNLIGVLPVVHFANEKSANELFGRPIYAQLIAHFSKYNDVQFKTVEGVELLGNPIPVFEGVGDFETFMENMAAMVEDGEDGFDVGEGGRRVIPFDKLPAIVTSEGKFYFVAPERGFTGDSLNTLRSLFLDVCQSTRIPEFLWGGAVEASKASTETQMPPFIQFIKALRMQFEGVPSDDKLRVPAAGGLHQLLNIWLRTKRLTDPKIVVEPVDILWQQIGFDNQTVELQKIIYADGKGYITEETALDKLNLVPDPRQEVALSAQRRELMQQDDFMSALNGAARRDMSAEGVGANQNEANRNPVAPRNPAGGEQTEGVESRTDTLEMTGALDVKRKRRRKRRRVVESQSA